MLKSGDVIENPVMGQRILFCKLAPDTQGAYVEVEYFNKPFTGKGTAPAHFHPTMTERFEILAGRARYRLDAAEREARTGDVLTFPRRVPHLHPWSISDEELHVRQTTMPDRPDIAALEKSGAPLVTLFGLARDGKVNKDGLPNPLQLAVLVYSMMPYAYLDGMPVVAQTVVFGALAGVGHLLGYRATYARYNGAA
jgi:mannose-6-phosphate isomerase-like protein (cupin superfamily)